jgi:CRISPR-associated endoribonuclease Cas6
MRTWNHYAPACLHIDKQVIRDSVKNTVEISDYDLHTTTLYFPKYSQKGFLGTCTYQLKTGDEYVSQITALANFARYAGVGYKTTMGMGQARMEFLRD